MANLTTLLACVAANQLAVATPHGIGRIHSVTLGASGPLFTVDLPQEPRQYEADQLTPILTGFDAFRAAAMRNDIIPLIALQMLASAVANVKLLGRHLRPVMAVTQAIEAPLAGLALNAKGNGRLDWQLNPYWNPSGEYDARQWQPVAVPGLAHFLLSHGYAAGLPAEDWTTEAAAPFFQLPSNN